MVWAIFQRLVDDWIYRRRVRWVEISLSRAWSHDMPPRLFDLSEP